MNTKRLTTRLALAALLVGAFAMTTNRADAGLLVYEGFDYFTAGDPHVTGAGDALVGQPNDFIEVPALGLSGAYTGSLDTTNATLRLKTGSLTTSTRFSGLTATGNHIGVNTSQNNTIASNTTVALNGSTDLWFSLVMQPWSSNGASQGGFAITDAPLTGDARIPSTTANEGVGIGSTASQNWRAFAWDNGVKSTGDAELSTGSGENYLMVGHISFNTGTAGADVYQLYEYTGVVGSGTLNAVGSAIEVDLNEANLNVINFTRQRLAYYDELRIADNLTDALTGTEIPEPASLALLTVGGVMIARRRKA